MGRGRGGAGNSARGLPKPGTGPVYVCRSLTLKLQAMKLPVRTGRGEAEIKNMWYLSHWLIFLEIRGSSWFS